MLHHVLLHERVDIAVGGEPQRKGAAGIEGPRPGAHDRRDALVGFDPDERPRRGPYKALEAVEHLAGGDAQAGQVHDAPTIECR